MGITNVLGLIGLIGIPIIIILYMLRPKNKPITIPSLYLWQQMSEEIESATKLKKLKSSILMFIQLFIVILLTLILAGLFLKNTNNADKVLIVVDSSYTMGSEDVDGNRLEYAKELVNDYIDNLSDESLVSVLALEEVPRTLMQNETDKGFIKNTIKQLQVIDGICDLELASETIELLREEGQEVVYFGDRKIQGVSRVLTVKETKNYSVHDISYTKYFEEDSITVLTEIFNHDDQAGLIPLSLYVDDVLFGAKQIEVEGESSGKIFFENIPIDTRALHIQIDEDDILDIDNHAYTMVQAEQTQKALLISESNKFLEKALGLHPNIELYVTDSAENLYGYDLYIFDGLMPVDFPRDGNYMIFDPDEIDGIELLGYVENPVFTTNNHKITNLIEQTEFSTRVTSVYNIEDSRDIIYNTEFGAGAFEMKIHDNKAVVFGFDVHQTDLPLSIEFPVMMMNSVEHLLNNQMVPNINHVAGESVTISIFPSTIKATITSPSGIESNLDLTRRELVYNQLTEVGTYTVVQESEAEFVSESFSVNVPLITTTGGSVGEGLNTDVPLSSKDLGKIIGIIVVVFMLIEWIIYSYRRRIHEYTL